MNYLLSFSGEYIEKKTIADFFNYYMSYQTSPTLKTTNHLVCCSNEAERANPDVSKS